jgi:cell wall-associated NlpC family hydrolase
MKNDFIEVALPDGRKGFVNKKDAAGFKTWSASVTPDPEKMIALAKLQLGTPYLWGGTSTKAFDCSGFVKTIYFTHGIILARDASQQFLHGSPVDYSKSLDSLKKGDLIFFGSVNEKGDQKITHVGMYIGDTEVIHCSGMVRINSLVPSRANYSEYLKNGMQGARRIIGSEPGKGLERIGNMDWYIAKGN